ncbi:MAG: IS66 family transposase [Bacteroidetes bacterium]|nr:IS66 family transposase [Bacteroidota bacterium]
MNREEIEKVYDQGKEAVVNLVEGLINEFTAQIQILTNRIEKLESQLAKDSHNSSKPPSSDGLKKKKRRTKSQRKKSGKKSGGQKGHKGKNLEMTDSPDETEKLSLNSCACCGKSLKNIDAKDIDKRQKFEIPKISVYVTEYQAEVKDCPHCGTECKATFPEGITHKTQYGNYLRSIAIYLRNYELIPLERSSEIFEDIFSIPLSEGTIVNATKKCAEALTGFHQWVLDNLIQSQVVRFDETGVNIGGKLHWLHNASTPLLTSYFVHKRRGSEAFNAMGILPVFNGKAVHDHWPAYLKYNCDHVLCNAHHLRELTFVFEHHNQPWAKKMIDLLCEVKAEVEIMEQQGKLIELSQMKKHERKFKRILKEGFNINPPPEPEKMKRRGRKRKGKVLCLLERLRDFQDETLAFMYDLNVPFDNNLAERDIRMVKVQQKISGLFRSFCGAEQFCLIRSFISTVKKQEFSVIDTIEKIIAGEQIYLEFSC